MVVEHVPDGFVEYALQVPLSQGGAFQVFMGLDLPRSCQGLLVRNWLHPLLLQALDRRLVIPQVQLGPNEYDGHVRRMVLDLGEPFRFDVVEGRWADDGEADQEDICLRVRQWSQSVVIFLPGRIPESKAYWFPINHNTCRIVVESGA